MAQFGYDANGELKVYAEYTIKGVETMRDVFPKNNKIANLLKLKNKQRLRDVYRVSDKTAVVRRVFYDFLSLVLDELTYGGMLVFPGKTKANIALKEMPDETVRKMSREGRLDDVDLAKAQYKVPQFKFDFGPSSARKDRHIKIPNRLWQKAFRNAENNDIKYTYYRKMLK